MKNPFEIPNNQNGHLTGLELMGDNLRKTIKYVGGVLCYIPFAK